MSKLRVGFDLDGVLLSNPLGVLRPVLKYIRKNILKKKSTGSYTPETRVEEFINFVYVKLSYFKMRGYPNVIKLINTGLIDAYIITARHDTYKDEFKTDIARLKKDGHFVGAEYNSKNLEPYVFKSEWIKKFNLDYYVEDNYDVVQQLSKRFPGRILWITNPVDCKLYFENKFTDLDGVADFLKTKIS